MKDEVRRWLGKNRVPNPICATLTEKQIFRGVRLDTIRSDTNFRHFTNLLNRKVYGNNFRRFKPRLSIFSVKEVSDGNRHHRHCLIEAPSSASFEMFVFYVEQSWRQTDFGYNHIHITKPSSQIDEDGWIDYILKFRTKTDYSTSIDWNNVTVPVLWDYKVRRQDQSFPRTPKGLDHRLSFIAFYYLMKSTFPISSEPTV